MKIAFKICIVSGLTLATITSCSRKKNSFINRNFHAVTAEYNALFNGYEALKQGQNNLNTGYKDNYWDILPIERMQVSDEIVLPGQSKNEDFTKAEEKAVKAIQKHGMNIKGKEYNPQIDEAYLLLGEARYFDQRFVPALEAFNYILYKYPASDKINTAKVWREKTNMRLENDELAIVNLKRLIKQEALEGQELSDATSILAQAYINTKSLDSALMQIKIASKATKNNDEKGRFNFIKGQLYNVLTFKDSANLAFDEVIDLNRKTPRRYLMAAQIEKAKNFDYDTGDKIAFLKHLTKLEENRENRPFLDKIYHQIGDFHLSNQSDSLAVAYYNKSLREKSQDKILVSKNYETLGDFYFDRNNYKFAGAYYDSTMTNMVENSKPFRTLKRKRENLDDVIYYEGLAETNDSILKIVKMPEAARLAYFTEYTNTLKQRLEAEKERLEIEERKSEFAVTNSLIDNANSPRGGLPGAGSTFYFYNPTTVAYGKNEFSRIWGDRKNEDNWRWSSARSGGFSEEQSNLELAIADGEESELLSPDYYLALIPSAEKELDSIKKERNYAYYQLGLIYKEKFKEYKLSKSKFLNLLESDPEEKLILPSNYNLYKIYEILGLNDEALITKNSIISNYPESRYADILLHPELAATRDENSPESLYEATYKLLEAQDFQEVIVKSKEYMTFFDGDAMVPKFALLKATANGRLNGYQAYIDGLNDVALAFANTPEAIQAEAIVGSLKSVSDKTFKPDTTSRSFKVVFEFNTNEKEALADFRKILDEVTPKVTYYNMSTSVDVFNPETIFLVVHGLRSVQGAEAFSDILKEDDRPKINRPYFGISSDNYKTLQIHKNINEYLANK
ncbi:tetratricopeptide repeat protein [Olleya sp. HaHaR_3_96]|uniref:type IX secretion system periplasmic lipoprotein PorW/SprE n=1 Tax=Olleya sp. HaHaR_3_96 TaxID=2745560 RepID=UPI001C4E3567|nr:hypothetical protein [Olleya sp. HaHaR_3_96]QXP60693.1 hypothetical protein H0I26_03380 [Olleya sp. HaHaR_3_96]